MNLQMFFDVSIDITSFMSSMVGLSVAITSTSLSGHQTTVGYNILLSYTAFCPS